MQETQEMQVRSLGHEDPLEEEMTTQSSILAWKILPKFVFYVYGSISILQIHLYFFSGSTYK